ncbi:hypothetical protein DAPPUDRAFT_317730 [Daphnia pulex]|uniref:Uncharacterized protein n=1 Tax=Daphnia pulex TaxID=6669 RepID=E9GGT3_DAPPU|nr:hypothetical protein DAPPUDRAFT_317730 [Daphnia pulex]|eukprot:EFX81080.1 hypothetical protein DAPPUDRAFT_317730 [Daphnia pulex]
MAAVSMLANVTHIDDSVLGGQETSVYFWGSTRDRSLYLTMELYLKSTRQHLESKAPPIHLSYLESYQLFCALINHREHRATECYCGKDKPSCVKAYLAPLLVELKTLDSYTKIVTYILCDAPAQSLVKVV